MEIRKIKQALKAAGWVTREGDVQTNVFYKRYQSGIGSQDAVLTLNHNDAYAQFQSKGQNVLALVRWRGGTEEFYEFLREIEMEISKSFFMQF